MQTATDKSINAGAPLQLVLFVDRRSSSIQYTQQVQDYLESAQAGCDYNLQVVDISEHPYLVEHFKLVASPALVKIFPEPRHTLAGSNLIAQLKTFWPQWQQSVKDFQAVDRSSVDGPNLDSPVKNDSMSTPTSNGHLLAAETVAGSADYSLREGRSHSKVSPLPKTFAYSTELLRLSDEIFRLKQEKEELQDQIQFKDRVIAMLAHDLRNPLTAASIALETLELGLNLKPEDERSTCLTPEMIGQLLKHARTQTRAIDRMITDILQGARDRGARLHIQPQDLELKSLCEDVIEYLRKQLQHKNQKIETDIPKDLPHVYADPERVRQVLVNLLDNAIKYTPERGTIQVSMLHRTTQKVQVSVCDNGPGIPEDSQQHVFEDHFRLQRDETQSGYGIGLSWCQRIIRAHYGQIWVDSVPGQGSCFHFTLPVYRFQ